MIEPQIVPTTRARPTTATVIPTSTWVAANVREKMSAPIESVPNGCAQLGGAKNGPVAGAIAGYGVQNADTSAPMPSMPMIATASLNVTDLGSPKRRILGTP